MNHSKIAFIGAGNICSALVNGLLHNNYAADNIFVANRSAEKLTYYPTVHTSTDNIAVANKADIIVLCVKPNQIKTVCQQLRDVCYLRQPIIVSVAASISTQFIAQQLNYSGAIIRAMPNTPAAIGLGAAGLFAKHVASAEQKQLAEKIFSSVGEIAWLNDEKLIEVVAALSGSGPAYLFLMMQAMQTAAEKFGLSAETAKKFTTQTFLGASKLAKNNYHEFAKLRQQVTSPNGTTLAALNVFEQHEFTATIHAAMQAAIKRAAEMARENQPTSD